MSEEDLQLLITLDDPGDGPEEDSFNHLQAKNTLEYWLGQWCQLEHRAEAATGNDAFNVTFGQGDWTCTLSRLSGTTEFCTVTQRKNGEIVEQKVFYDLLRMQRQVGIM